MRIIKLNTKNRTFSLKTVKNQFSLSRPKHVVKLNQVGRRGLKGDPGDPATNLVTSVNGKQGVVVLNSSDVGADASGAAAQALTDAKAYTDQEVGDIDTGVLSVTAGTNVTVDNTDPKNPIVSAAGGGSGDVESVNGQTGVVVLDADDIDDTSTTHKFATASQLSNADSAVQPGDLATVATSGDYDDLTNKPTIPDELTDLDTSVTGSQLNSMKSKLDGIEANADVTDAANVASAGAVMEADTSTASMSFVIDEDDMASDSATKIPTQQSVKAYVDDEIAGAVRSLGLNAHPFFTVVNNTTTETSLQNSTYTLPANTVGNNSILKWALTGTLKNNSGGDIVFTIRIKFGSLTWVTHTLTLTTHATARSFVINIPTLCADFLGTRLAGTSTINLSDPAGGADYIKSVNSAIDVIALSSNQTINITVQMDTASAEAEANLYTAVLNVSKPA